MTKGPTASRLRLTHIDSPSAVAVDRSGNVFVTGSSVGTTGYPDYLTIGYSGSGAGLWTNRYDGSVNHYCPGIEWCDVDLALCSSGREACEKV
jgi:hypothetical protein